MSGPAYRGFSDRKEAVAYARETGLPLGRRRPDAHLKRLGVDLYFVGRFSAYYYEEADPYSSKIAPRS